MPRKRNVGKRSIKPVMRVFTEGEKTEINYVRGYIHSYLRSKGYIAQDIIVEQPNDTSPPMVCLRRRNVSGCQET